MHSRAERWRPATPPPPSTGCARPCARRRPAGPVDPQRRPLRRRGRRPPVHPSTRRPVHRTEPRARPAAQGRARRALLPDPPAARPRRLAHRGGLRAALARPRPHLDATAADGGVAARPVGRPGSSQDRQLPTHDPASGRGRRRTRGMAPPTTAADSRWLRQRPGLVFATRNGRPVDQRNVGRAFHRARTAAGVDHGSLKTFRSTVATQLADAGLHPIKTQAFLGHAHVTTTLTYYTAITRRRRRRRPPPRPHLIDETHHGRRKPILVVRAELRLHETLHQPTGRA
jgi:hypothetical protein